MNKKEYEVLFEYVNKRMAQLSYDTQELVDETRLDIIKKINDIKFKGGK